MSIFYERSDGDGIPGYICMSPWTPELREACQEYRANAPIFDRCGPIEQQRKCTSDELAAREARVAPAREKVLAAWEVETAYRTELRAERAREELGQTIGLTLGVLLTVAVVVLLAYKAGFFEQVRNLSVAAFVAIIAALMLLAAILPIWPYGYYMLLRVVVFAAGGFCAWALWQEARQPLAVALGIVAVVFNPFIPAHLSREVWAVLNLAAAGLFTWTAFTR